MTPSLPAATTLILLLALVTVGYVLTVITWPFVTCRRCSGTGKTRSWINPRTHRLCRRCDGTGRRLRIARHLWNFFRRLHHDATTGTTGRTDEATR